MLTIGGQGGVNSTVLFEKCEEVALGGTRNEELVICGVISRDDVDKETIADDTELWLGHVDSLYLICSVSKVYDC